MRSAPTRLFNWPVVWHSRGRAGWRFRRLSAPTNNYLRPPVLSCSRSSTLAHLVESASLNTLTIAASPPCHWLRVLCGHPSLNTEHTEHLRDLSVEALEARRPQRTSHVLRPTGRAVNSSWNLQLMPVSERPWPSKREQSARGLTNTRDWGDNALWIQILPHACPG